MGISENEENKKQVCTDYNCDIIINIFKTNNTAEHSKVFNCLRTQYLEIFIRGVLFPDKYIKTELLRLKANDAFEEAMEAFFINVQNNLYKKQADCILYLKGIFKNIYFKKIEKEQRRIKRESENNRRMSFHDDEDDLASRNRISEEVHNALKKMTVSCNNYLTWFYFEDLSIRQISVIKGITEDTAKTGLWRCRQAFKNYLMQ